MKQYVVDVFADQNFKGNQAAVCIFDSWISDELMQNIAKENNFSETAFAVKNEENYELRWFTPNGEIDFCGHATIGTAYVINRFYDTKPQYHQIYYSAWRIAAKYKRRNSKYDS